MKNNFLLVFITGPKTSGMSSTRNLTKTLLTVLSASCFTILLSAANARADTIAWGNDGTPHYLEITEAISDAMGWSYSYDDDGALNMTYGVTGTKVTYNIYNNSTYSITGFAVGVDSLTGSNAEDEIVSEGWSGGVVNRWGWGLDSSYWENQLSAYDYAYYARVYEGFAEPGNSDYVPPGVPLGAFSGFTDEFSFTYDDGTLGSPVMFFVTDGLGREFIIEGESSHSLGEHREYVSDAAPVPEPSTIVLFTTGLLGLSGVVRKRKK